MKKIGLGLVLWAMTTSTWAASAVAQLNQFVQSVQSASGQFSQATTAKNGKKNRAQSGDFVFQRPGKFRWQTKFPFEQLVIADGKQLLQYDKDLNQLTKRSVEASLGASPAALLFGKGQLEQNFTLTEQAPRGGLDWVLAVPKQNNAGFVRVLIGMKNGVPIALYVDDAFGQTTHIQLSNIKTNINTSSGTFSFVPPAGVDIVTMN